MHIHPRQHRQAHAQGVLLQLLGVQLDPHGHALHHLDPVAGGVLRRQQGRGGAGGNAQAADFAVIHHLVAIGVGGQAHRLADADAAQLAFLEVGVHPHLAQRHHRHQRRAGGHALAQLHRTLAHVARHRRRHHRAVGGQPGLAQLGGRRQHAGVLLDRRAIGQRLVAGQLLARGGHAGLRGLERAVQPSHLRARMRQLLARHRAAAGQALAARQVLLGRGQLGLRAARVGLAQAHLGIERAVVGIQRAHLAHRLAQRGLGLRQRQVGIGAVQLDQGRASLDAVGLVGIDGRHRATDLRRDLHHVALHVGVVGVLEAGQHQAVVGAPGQAQHHHRQRRPHQGALARGAIAGVVHGHFFFGSIGRFLRAGFNCV